MKIVKKEINNKCYCCNNGIRGKAVKRKTCPACGGTGIYKETIFYHFYTAPNGKKYCIDGDTGK